MIIVWPNWFVPLKYFGRGVLGLYCKNKVGIINKWVVDIKIISIKNNDLVHLHNVPTVMLRIFEMAWENIKLLVQIVLLLKKGPYYNSIPFQTLPTLKHFTDNLE